MALLTPGTGPVSTGPVPVRPGPTGPAAGYGLVVNPEDGTRDAAGRTVAAPVPEPTVPDHLPAPRTPAVPAIGLTGET